MGGQSLILLDTHVLIWLDQADSSMGTSAREAADDALQEGALAVSAISFWEIALLVSKGQLMIRHALRPWRRHLTERGLVELPMTGTIAILAAELDGFHADPADRLIVATAREHGAVLVTADQRILDWPGDLRCRDARL